jgi:2-dehydropantoate 2-reductase
MSERRQTVAVIGVGSIGGIAAASLVDARRHDVIACMRRPVSRLTLERPGGVIEAALNAPGDPAQVAPVDWVLLATKAQATASAAPWLARLCGPSTRVAVMQNGIDHAARVAPFIGKAKAVPVIVYYNGERLGADRVRMTRVAAHDLTVADDGDGRAFADLLAGSGLSVELAADFTTLAWRKLLVNVVVNPVSALTLQRQGVFRRDDVRALCLDILAEAIAVGRAAGARLEESDAERTMASVMRIAPDLGTSMYFDRLAGRPLEIEALTGAIVTAGERLGIATPLNRAMLTLLRVVSDAAAQP